jgi:hypothetical protein
MESARLVILVFLASCAASADDAGTQATTAQAISPFAGFCANTTPGRWHSQSIAQRTSGVTTFQFTATIYNHHTRAPVDAIVGFSDQIADDFGDLGPILRFNADGVIDARNGDAYMADVVMPYVSNSIFDDTTTQYFVRMVVDMDAHRYSVFVREQDGPERQLANNYAFRTEQAALSRIGNVATFVDSSEGAAFFCDGKVTPPVCASSNATSGWHTATTYPEPGPSYIVEVDVVPQGSNIDAIVGLASSAPSAYSELAAIMRFNSDGLVDARDGDTYRAFQRVPYTANHSYTFVYIVDLARGTYSSWLDDPSGVASFVVADHYAFRTEQAGATSLGVIGQKVDAGNAQTCDVAVWPL